MQSPEEIDNQKVEAEKDLNKLLSHAEEVKQAVLLLQREILEFQWKITEIRRKQKDLEITLSKATHNIQVKKNEISILKSQFWAAKG